VECDAPRRTMARIRGIGMKARCDAWAAVAVAGCPATALPQTTTFSSTGAEQT